MRERHRRSTEGQVAGEASVVAVKIESKRTEVWSTRGIQAEGQRVSAEPAIETKGCVAGTTSAVAVRIKSRRTEVWDTGKF